ncbi:uncharacterized protein KY384_002564 [Bacidia gigantensis]|uniref:uncharacterized protein n=1 Tax=Bacidia gigantensis TaxID=2732470 RepID=UPI001D057A2D|nr:uncharacterized protein KY384_002564 [Bacidia gigantensis]KAG8532687.1 hypothetical protein KY384_002564 [Bacidia gigantensis]
MLRHHIEISTEHTPVAQRNIPIESGILFANPIPKESSIPRDEMELTISQALADAKAAGSSGSENTPFVLNRIRQITDGRTVAANRALIESNVACGTKLAVEISRLGSEERGRRTEPSSDQDLHKEESELSRGKTVRIPKSSSPADPLPVLSSHSKSAERKASLSEVVVAGSVAIDLSCDYLPRTSQDEISRPNLQTSNPASIQQSVGGVGSNVASALQYFGKAPKLCSIVGSDAAGSIAIDELSQRGLRTDGLRLLKEERTARYVAVNDSSRSLMVGMADMRILEQQESLYAAGQLEIDSLTQWIDSKPDWLIVDSNWGPTTMRAWFRAGRLRQARIAVEPVSVAKAKRLFTELPHQAQALDLPVFPSHLIDIATPNVLELASLFDAAKETGHFDREDWFNVINSIDLSSAGSRQKFEKMMGATIVDHGLPQRALHLLPFIPCIITTLGKDGVLLTQLLPPNDSRLTSASAAPYILSRSIAGNLVGGVYMRLFPVPEHISAKAIVSVNGAGDTFLGVLIAALIHLPSRGVEDAIDIAQKASAMTLKSNKAVSPELSALEHLL